MKKYYKICIVVVIVIVIIVVFFKLHVFSASTPRIYAEGAKSVSTLQKVRIGGVDQYICMRGKNIANPVLLFLHGGPGDAMLPVMTAINKNLEDDFVVVNWEQRGAGKSYYPFLESENIGIDTFISDTHELTNYLLKEFNTEKIYIMGNSWGSAIAIQAVQKWPELYYAYIGIGQVVNMKENERLSYEFTLDQSIERKDIKAEKELRAIGLDPFSKPDWFKSLLVQRGYLLAYGGALYGKTNYSSLEKHFITSPEYSLIDIIKRLKGSKQSVQMLWHKLLEVNLFETATQFEIPIYFLEGRHDYNAPTIIAIEYFDTIKAPLKKLIWFENSAHFPQWEEPQKFHEVLKDMILIETDSYYKSIANKEMN